MSKYILGGGLVGLLAAEILGPEYAIIPHKASRYYSFKPALADDHFSISPRVDKVLLGSSIVRPYKRAISLGGQLFFTPPQWVQDSYTSRLYGEPHPYFDKIMQWDGAISDMRASELYKRLLNKYIETLTANMAKYGHIVGIADGRIKTSTGFTAEYDNIVSTIPLDALDKALGIDRTLHSLDAWCFHVKTNKLDFEGANQVLVADEVIPFYKVNKIGINDYVFYCLEPVQTPHTLFSAFTSNECEVVNPSGTLLKSFIPVGTPDTQFYKRYNISCVGSHAEWDDLVDLSTCILRLLDIKTS